MKQSPYRFDRLEFAGSLGDLGTLIPLSVALITLTDLHFTPVMGAVGLFYIATGLYFRLPIPVQPLKVVAALAIAFPHRVTLPVMSATGLLFGALLLALAASGLIEAISRLFTKAIVRGIQFGLGLILIQKGIQFLRAPELLIPPHSMTPALAGVSLNFVIGLLGALLTLFLLNSRRFPAALILVGLGILVGIAAGALRGAPIQLGPSALEIAWPGASDLITALWFLVLPQIPLTIGNAIVGTRDATRSLFGEAPAAHRVTNRSLSLSMGLANLAVGLLAAMPLCHGAGGLAAHYRFGARTGGANLMIGAVFVIIALVCGGVGVMLLAAIPQAVLGVLLIFAGLELGLLIRDVRARGDLFLVLLVAGTGMATTHMGVAFVVGILASWIIRQGKVRI